MNRSLPEKRYNIPVVSLLVLFLVSGIVSRATPTCPIITNQFQGANGVTIDNSATGWSVDSSGLHAPHPANFFFGINSNRFTATNLGGIGIINSKVFNISGYKMPQVSVKITSENVRAIDSLTDYIEFYYKLDGGPLVLVAHQNGVVGSLTFTSPVLHGTTVQLVIKLKNVDNGTGTKSNYYVERYDVFQTGGPCTPGTATLTVTPSATNGGLITCTNTSTTLSGTFTPTAATNVSYYWSGPSFSNTTTSTSPSVSAPGVDTLIVTVGTGGTSTVWGMATIPVTKNITPPANVTATSSNALTCVTGSTTLTGTSSTAGSSFAWTGPNSFSVSGASTTTATAGGYTVKATNPANGCTATASTTVVQNTSLPANITASVDSVLTCNRNTVHLTAGTTTTGVTYTWTTPAGASYLPSAVPDLPVSAEGVYTVKVTNTASGCSATTTVSVVRDSSPPDSLRITPGNGLALINCTTPTVTLTASSTTPGLSYTWTAPNGTTSTGANFVASTAGVYNVYTARPSNGCISNINVTVVGNFTVPGTPTITGNMPLNCTRTQINLIATGPDTANFSWTGPGSFVSASPLANVSIPGNYVLTATHTISGCSSTASYVVTQDTATPASVRSTASPVSAQITCAHPTVVLTGSSTTAGVTFSWTGNNFSASGAAATVSLPGIYTVTATNPANGCASLATGNVTRNINAPIGVTAGTSDVISCFTPSVFVTGSSTTAGATFSWAGPDGFTANTDNAETAEPGIYTLTVTNPVNGCITTATAVVEDNTTPPTGVTATNSGPLSCINTSATLSGSATTPDVIYTWVAPDQSLIQGATTTVTVPGTYTLVVSDQDNGCASIATTTVSQTTNGCPGGSAQAGNSISATGAALSTDAGDATGGTTGLAYKVYPNPFSAQTSVEFRSSINTPVTVELYNSIGVRERILFSGNALAYQSYKLELGKGDLLSGTYFCIIRSNGKAYVTKLILVK